MKLLQNFEPRWEPSRNEPLRLRISISRRQLTCRENSELVDVQQLTAGASQQTFRVSVRQREGHEAHYALRRAQPGLERTTYGQVTPSVEAELLELASFAQVPVPKVIESLQSTDGLGDGYLMEWLEGETMG